MIPNFGRLTTNLYSMAQVKEKNCVRDTKALQQFAELKQALVSAPILAFPNYNLPFVIQTDASQNTIGRVLLQKTENLFKPIVFASRKLSDTERRYSATERELLAIVYCYDQFHSYVFGRKIEFYTENDPLVTSSKLKKPLGRLGRLFHRLQDVDNQIFYLPGESNYLPDFLCRSYHEEATCNFTEIKSRRQWYNRTIKQNSETESSQVCE
jgi:hypothetical protein